MKKLVHLLALTTLLSVFAVGCKKDSDELTKKNSFNYDNKDYELSNAYLVNYNEEDDTYGLDLGIISSNVKVVEENGEVFPISGIGNIVYFSFWSKSKELAIGEYRFNEDNDSVNTFYGDFGFNYNFETEKGSALEITGGTVNVIKSGTEYELTFDLIAEDGKKVTGYYKGVAKFYDYSAIDNIFLSKQQGFSMRKRFSTEVK